MESTACTQLAVSFNVYGLCFLYVNYHGPRTAIYDQLKSIEYDRDRDQRFKNRS